MSRLSSYLRQYGGGLGLELLMVASRAANVALALVGIAMLIFAGQLYGTQQQPGLSGSNDELQAALAPPSAPAIAFGAMGLAACTAAAAGLGASRAHSLPLLNMHLTLLSLLLAAQVCLVAAVATGDANDDAHSTGGRSISSAGAAVGSSARQQLRHALLAYTWADAVAMSVEVTTLLFGCLLHAAYQRADDAAEDLEEGLLSGSSSDPLLRTPPARAGQRTDSWSRRMRDQYGVDTAAAGYNPPQRSPAPTDATAAPSRRA